MLPKNCLAYLVALCFEMRCPKTKYRCFIKLKMFNPAKTFWAGYAIATKRIFVTVAVA